MTDKEGGLEVRMAKMMPVTCNQPCPQRWHVMSPPCVQRSQLQGTPSVMSPTSSYVFVGGCLVETWLQLGRSVWFAKRCSSSKRCCVRLPLGTFLAAFPMGAEFLCAKYCKQLCTPIHVQSLGVFHRVLASF
jgi:hypothetical protein